MEDENDQNATNICGESEKKIVVVGDKGCGKSSLIASFVWGSLVDVTQDLPEDARKTISFGRERVTVVLLEERADPLFTFDRIMDYHRMKAAIVCFAFDDTKSMRSIPNWIEELMPYVNPMDLYVVGCKLDLKHEMAICVREWIEIEKAFLSYKYLECSAKTGEGVSHLVRIVGDVLLNQQQNEDSVARL